MSEEGLRKMHQSVESAQLLSNGDFDWRQSPFSITFFRGEGIAKRKVFAIESIGSRENAIELKKMWLDGASMAAVAEYCRKNGVKI